MKKTLAIILLAILTLSLFLCGCNKDHSHSHGNEEGNIVKKTEIRQNDNSVIIVYEDGYERTYSVTQPIEVFEKEDGSRAARAIGILSHPYSYWFGSADGPIYQFQVSEPKDSATSQDGIIIVGPLESDDHQIQVGELEESATSQSGIVIEATRVETVYFLNPDESGRLYSSFEHNGKMYQDCEIDVLTILFQKTTLIDFVTGYEKNSIDSVANFRYFANLEAVILPTSLKKVERNAFDQCNKLTTVYYYGTAEEWANVELEGTEIITVDKESKNETVEIRENALAKCTVYFYSKTAPTAAGNYWHFVDGKPVVW